MNNVTPEVNLFFVLLGCRPMGRKTEQHDVFAGIGTDLRSLIPAIQASWPESGGKLHLDAWRQVRFVAGYRVRVVAGSRPHGLAEKRKSLWFVNLGGYAPGFFEEFHQKLLLVAEDQADAIFQAKQQPFFKEYHMQNGGAAHIDDKWSFEVDDVASVDSLLPPEMRDAWYIVLEPDASGEDDPIHLGYFKLSSI